MADVEIKRVNSDPVILHNISLIVEDNSKNEYVFIGANSNGEKMRITIPLDQVEYVRREV